MSDRAGGWQRDMSEAGERPTCQSSALPKGKLACPCVDRLSYTPLAGCGAESNQSPFEPTHLWHGVYDSMGDELRLLLVVTWPGVPR